MTGDWEPDVEDIAALRRENGGRDLREFMRQQIATGRARRAEKPAKPTRQVPGHRPGAWPPGTRPPDRPPPIGTRADWEQALADYRAYLRREVLNRDDPEETP